MAAARASERPIRSAEQARAWLTAADAPWVQTPFLDDLGHVAEFRAGPDRPAQRWEHLYGCWVRVAP